MSVIFGGNSGAANVTLTGLNTLALGSSGNVSLPYVPSYGRTAPVAGPPRTRPRSHVGLLRRHRPAVRRGGRGDRPGLGRHLGRSNEYTIRHASSGLYLARPSSSAGATVTLVSSHSGSSGFWRFGTDAGHETIVNAATGDLLGVQQRPLAAHISGEASGDPSVRRGIHGVPQPR